MGAGDRRHEGRGRRPAPARGRRPGAQPGPHLRLLRGRGDRLRVQRAAPPPAAASRPPRRRRLRRPPRADRISRRGWLQGHPPGRRHGAGGRRALGASLAGTQRHPRGRGDHRPAHGIRPADGDGRRPRVPGGALRGGRPRRRRRQRHPRRVHGHGQLPVRARPHRGGGDRPGRGGVRGVRGHRDGQRRRSAARTWTDRQPGPSSRRSGSPSSPSRAGPTSPASPRWGSRPSTSAPATRPWPTTTRSAARSASSSTPRPRSPAGSGSRPTPGPLAGARRSRRLDV